MSRVANVKKCSLSHIAQWANETLSLGVLIRIGD